MTNQLLKAPIGGSSFLVFHEQKSFSQKWGPRVVAGAVAIMLAGAFLGFDFSVTVLAILGVLGGLAGIVWPGVGLFAVGLLSTIDPLMRVYLLTGGLLRWNTFNYVLILAMLVWLPRVLRLRDLPSRILAVFVVLMVLQLSFTPALDVGLYNVLNVLAGFGLLLYHVRVGADREMMFWIAALNGVVAAIGGGVYFLQIASLPEINKNAWSAFPLTALFSIAAAFPFTKSRGAALSLGVLGVVNATWIFFSGSRGGMLIALGCLAFLLYYTEGMSQKFAGLGLVVATTLVILANFGDQQQFAIQRINKLFDSSRALESRTSGRSDLVIAGWYIFRENPLGVGTGGFGPTYAGLVDNEIAFTGHEKGAHSAWVKTLAENGLLGILILAAYVFSFAANGWKRRRDGFLPFGLLVTFVLASAFFAREFQSKGLWFLAAGYITLSSYGGLCGSPASHRQRAASISRLNGAPIQVSAEPRLPNVARAS